MSLYEGSMEMLERSLRVIPLSNQKLNESISTLSLGAAPFFVNSAKGSKFTDVDGNEFIDFTNGLASVMIGHGDEEINQAVKKQIDKGISYSLPHILETEVAEKIIDIVPAAEMVYFGKNENDAASAAIRLSRVYTGKEKVLVCSNHELQDWIIDSSVRGLGIPKTVKDLTINFNFNDLESLEKAIANNKNEIACLIMEAMNVEWPEDGFLDGVQRICQENDIIFVLDEVVTGFRFARGGASELFEINPDLVCLGKGLGNGYPISIVAGKKEIMKLMQDIFYSEKLAGKSPSLAAVSSTLDKIKNTSMIETMTEKGNLLLDGVKSLITKHRMEDILDIKGHPTWTFLISKNIKGYTPIQIKTFLLKALFEKGIFFIGTHNISHAHSKEDINEILKAYDVIMPMLKKLIEEDKLIEFLNG